MKIGYTVSVLTSLQRVKNYDAWKVQLFSKSNKEQEGLIYFLLFLLHMCVCVCERERERERDLMSKKC